MLFSVLNSCSASEFTPLDVWYLWNLSLELFISILLNCSLVKGIELILSIFEVSLSLTSTVSISQKGLGAILILPCFGKTIEWESHSARLLLEIITPFSLATQSLILSSFWIIFSLLRPVSDSCTIFLSFSKSVD